MFSDEFKYKAKIIEELGFEKVDDLSTDLYTLFIRKSLKDEELRRKELSKKIYWEPFFIDTFGCGLYCDGSIIWMNLNKEISFEEIFDMLTDEEQKIAVFYLNWLKNK